MSDTAPALYRVQAESTVGGAARASAKQATIVFDASAGQSEEIPGPADLLASAFAACVLKNVERFSESLPFRYERAFLTVEAQRQSSPPKITSVHYVLRVVTDEPERRLQLLHTNIRRHGTIFNTLAAVCSVTGEIVAEPVG
ncbi:OsmC family protein [Actinocorallia sp. B10E7]|uniref:OsmC family protein n=1 Tax=Actinocorallia sp. B10E7 TaxID=3153558 RepID=UPI00325C614D